MEEKKDTLTTLREATRNTPYEGKLYLVGGYVRDKLLGNQTLSDDIDLVLEGDALEAARFLWKQRITDYAPVEYGQFGTTQIQINGAKVELVTARSETYRQGSRKPIVVPGTLQTDAERRDFTINTFLENLHTSEITDPTGQGYPDLEARILRTPADPFLIFRDDPLRMLRACRFAAKLGFTVEETTYTALCECASLCNPEHGISYERIREEFTKTLLTSNARRGLEMMRETGILTQFAPELVALHGVTQNDFHKYDVWTHTLVAVENLPPATSLNVRLAMLFHDIGKPATRTVDPETSKVHFYHHEEIGATMTTEIMTRLRFPKDIIHAVTEMVGFHMRYGGYRTNWSNASVRRLIRAVGTHREDLFIIARADVSACNLEAVPPQADLNHLAERMEKLETEVPILQMASPLTGEEIITLLHLTPGPTVGKIKAFLTDKVVAGELDPSDKNSAVQLAKEFCAAE